MLAIEVEFLLGRYFAADFRDETAPEWPPHPDRLFEALVAAHHDTFGSTAEREVFAFIEKLGPPQIAAGECGIAERVVNFVPTNYEHPQSRSLHPDHRGKQPRSFPVQGPSTPIVHFIWPTAEADPRTLKLLSGLLDRVPSLGRSCSLVRARLADSVHPAVWVPNDNGSDILRTFGQGRLHELEVLHKIGRRPSVGQQRQYAKAEIPDYRIETSFGEMIVFQRLSGRPLPIEAALTLTSCARAALLKLAESENDSELKEAISGHGDSPHCAFVALPFVGNAKYADGRLMGFAVVLPRAVTPALRRSVVRLCAGLDKINIKENETLWDVTLSGFDVVRETLRPGNWVRKSKVWASVTPILLDQFPKKNLSVAEIICNSCERIGLPAPTEISYSTHSKQTGVPPALAFRLRRKSSDIRRLALHATLEFSSQVKGPLLIGAGRFFGLGLMKPLH